MDRKSFPTSAAAAISLVAAGGVYVAADLGFRALFGLGVPGDFAAAMVAGVFGGPSFRAAFKDSEAFLLRRGERTLDPRETIELLSKPSAGYLLVALGLVPPYPIVSSLYLPLAPTAAKAVF